MVPVSHLGLARHIDAFCLVYQYVMLFAIRYSLFLHGLMHALYLPPLQEILASSQSSEPGHPGCY